MKKYQKKICIITSSRADYGLLRNLIKKLYQSKKLKYHLSVTGTHLSFKHGYTLKEILKDKNLVNKKLNILNYEDNDLGNFVGKRKHAYYSKTDGGSKSPDFIDVCDNMIINPDATKGRYMYSAICDSLTLSMDAGTNGGKLTTSGTFFGGYRPIQYNNSGITINDTDYTTYGGVQNIFEMDNVTIGGNPVICKAFSVTITNPVARAGHVGITELAPGSAGTVYGQPDAYVRSGNITVEGSMTVKYDDQSRALLDNWLDGTSTAIVFGDAAVGSATCFFGIPTAKFTGYNKDYAGEDGVYIELPFIGTAEGSNSLIDLKIT